MESRDKMTTSITPEVKKTSLAVHAQEGSLGGQKGGGVVTP